ncbi:unnamed protein product [Didymodactylos carnosus]|uniref:Uncharacterized protein n=1 Tax=Didymodactylos carnosus TaxID=1234261 RepID=A0A8S2DF42_9BILA|nr:unnamed protein product [Didymodactylos carnosus]CAF3701579.1 unnamed protein product [Didymodactylos carnosus]
MTSLNDNNKQFVGNIETIRKVSITISIIFVPFVLFLGFLYLHYTWPYPTDRQSSYDDDDSYNSDVEQLKNMTLNSSKTELSGYSTEQYIKSSITKTNVAHN